MNYKKHACVALAAFLTVPALGLARRARLVAQAPPMTLESIETPEGLRWYRLALPDEPLAAPYPVVFLFHGGGGNALQAAGDYGVVEEALERGYVAVAPEGTGALAGPPLFALETWNSGSCCGSANENQVDDVAFFELLLDELVATRDVDPERVFLTGMSNGAMMSYRIAVERSELVTAIAPVAGALDVEGAPTEPVGILAIHGLLDENVPFEGGIGSGVSGLVAKSQAESWVPFVEANGGSLPLVTVPFDQGQFFAALAPPNGSHSYYYFAFDGGHSWPGGSVPKISPNEPVHQSLPATPLMFDFFDLYSRGR